MTPAPTVVVVTGALVVVVTGALVVVVTGALVVVVTLGWNIRSVQYCEDLQLEEGNLLLEPYAYTPEFDEGMVIGVVANVAP
ncbi:MAG: hypothetical protein LCH98_14310 [Actinobacteria bacterium]|nr:hypothetical protein [Actinomycetota bacterium]